MYIETKTEFKVIRIDTLEIIYTKESKQHDGYMS